ncbi:purine catabolism regulator [Mycobacterium frederiksbergense]|uniref:Purine catabolism regulator n=1 Tax=Mycolicibacterium frederiksbergense TaxID=117567 RepID=A0ABT6KTY4_9MYCO|nr:PucR family transcriptional regulator [Mycolicibacterium frederiksbergense]MDH6194119.1 purine catabolism regulator [Mycolicibacterium frederiksbergense]
MPMTVGDLFERPHLRLRVHAGQAGLSRQVLWTHVSDLPEPWRWVSRGELLMTNGLSFPKSAKDQAELVHRLLEAGVPGLVIGEQMYCPPLTRTFERVSNELQFPVLWVGYPLPFSLITRAVAEATLVDQSQRLMRTVRIYDLIRRQAARGLDRADLLRALSRELGCELYVCTRSTGDPWFPDTAKLEDPIRDAVAKLSGGSKNVASGAFGLPSDDSKSAMLTDIPRHPGAALVTISDVNTPADSVQTQHAATVVSLELTQTELGLEHQRAYGAGIMTRMLEGRIDGATMRDQLTEFGLEEDNAVVISASAADRAELRNVHVWFWRFGIPCIGSLDANTFHALVPDEPAVEHALRQALGPDGRVGFSGPLHRVARFSDASREANWALSSAVRLNTSVSKYGTEVAWVGLSNAEDAQALVDRLLRPLEDYDASTNSSLVETLECFLENRRSWTQVAEAMHLHRQTVAYRIRRIEEIGGCSLADTATISQYWLALNARDLLGEPGPPRKSGL